PLERLAARRHLQASLSRVHRRERVPLRSIRMPARRLDERHVGAEVREDPPTQPARRVGEIEDAYAFEHRSGQFHAPRAAVTSAAATTSARSGSIFSAEKRCQSSGKDAQQSSTTTTRRARLAAARTRPSTARFVDTPATIIVETLMVRSTSQISDPCDGSSELNLASTMSFSRGATSSTTCAPQVPWTSFGAGPAAL